MSAGFVSLHRGEQDQAARASVALTIRRLEREVGALTEDTIEGVGEYTHHVIGGTFAFPASSVGRWQGYANAVARSDERISNRKWDGYSSAVRAAALQVADMVRHEMGTAGGFPTND
ncbi:MAG: hypothetical protein GY832_08455 [Chloroflexi bacterium]|nr:hypothetical protein [Chloroflexota bacterium]